MPAEKEQQPLQPEQSQERPGSEARMNPQPIYDDPTRKGSDRLKDKIALITGGDSGIGRAVAVLFAKEGADIAFSYLNESEDAAVTQRAVEQYGRRCISIAGDIQDPQVCIDVVRKTADLYGRIDVLVNNAAMHCESQSLEELSDEQLLRTFNTNVFSQFRITRAALPHMGEGSAIICTTSVTAYRGSKALMDYASTKAAIVGFVRSLSQNLESKKIRVNGVAPGPIWTPLIASSFDPERVASHGSEAPMERVGQPVEVAPAYLFLATSDASYLSGQVIHPNGGEIVNG